MAIYRPEMAIFTYGPEKAEGAYDDTITGTLPANIIITNVDGVDVGDGIILKTGNNDISGVDVGDYIIFTTAANPEIRRALAVSGEEVVLDFPVSYVHTGASIAKITTEPTSATGDTAVDKIPGVYETVDLPDIQPEFMEKYLLNQESDRNWTYMYRGRETLQGSCPNIILLDGTPLVYLLGGVRHGGTYDTTVTSTVSPYFHTIYGSTERLPTMTWDLQLRATNTLDTHNFSRRYVGGTVNRATISANEGEVLMMGWEEVLFLDLVHNQTKYSDTVDMPRGSATLIHAVAPANSSMVNRISYPNTQPYYFSQGYLEFFGMRFARVRNFRIEINNNIEPRFYIRRSSGDKRGPTELQPQRRQLSMTVSVAMPDSQLSTYTMESSLWKEFILQGNYQSLGSIAQLQGFNMVLEFSRGNNDYIRIVSPHDEIGISFAATDATATSLSKSTTTSAFSKQGCFFRRVSHNLGQESPIQVEGDIVMRNMAIQIKDNLASTEYPV